MSRRASPSGPVAPGSCGGFAAAALAGAALALAAPAPGAISPEHARLLAASDPFAAAPAEVRLELSFVAPSGAEVPLEIWRKGDELALVRFLGEKDRGKFVLRRGAESWLLAPGVERPVKMKAALAAAGPAALDELLALRLSTDYRAVEAHEESGVVRFDLVAVAPGTEPPQLRWVVGREKRLPLRAEFRSADGRVRRLVEFKGWRDAAKKIPAEVVVKDVLRGGAPLTIRIRALEERSVPEALFDLDDARARNELPSPPTMSKGESP